MLKISVVSEALREIPYTDKKGKPQTLYVQTAYLYPIDSDGVVSPLPDKFEVVLPRGVITPHRIGDYQLHPSAIQVVNGRLSCEARLTPFRAPAKAAA